MGHESDATMALDTLDLDDLRPSAKREVAAAPPPVPSPGGAHNDFGALDPASLDDAHLMQCIERELSASADPERSARLHFELGWLYERAGEREQACEHFQKAYTLAPDHVAAVRAARRLLCVLGRYDEALPLFEAEAPHTLTSERRARLAYEKGRLLEGHLARIDEALESYRQGLELAPRDPDLLRAAARIERSQRRWEELDRTLESLGSAVETDPTYRAQVLAERACIADLHGNDPLRSLELYLAAIEEDAEVPGATEALKRLAHHQGQWRSLLEALQREAQRSEDAEVRASACARVAQLCLHPLGDLERAAAALEEAVTESPSDGEWLSQLVQVYDRADRPQDEARVLDALRGMTHSPAERADLAHRIGLLHETRLSDGSRAEQFYRAALESDPSHAPALQSLTGLYRSTANHAALLELLERQTEGAPDAMHRAALHVQAGQLLERMGGDVERALHHYRRALSLDPTQLTALRALDRMLPVSGRFADLVQVYEEMVDHAADDEQALLYLFRIGALQEDRLGDLPAAIHAYERVLRRSSGHTGALHALQRVAMAARDYALLVSALEQEMALREPSPHWAALGYRIAELYVDVLEEPSRAIPRLSAILEHDPKYVQARDLLTRVYRSERRWEDLVRMRGAELERVAEGPPRAALAYELGTLCETELGQVEAAIDHYAAALDAAPLHRPAFDALTRLFERERMWERLVKTLEARGEAVPDPRERAHLAVRRGRLREGPLGDPEGAQRAYVEALTHVPGFPAAQDARSRLLSQEGRHADLAQALLEEAEVSRDGRRSQEALLRRARLQADLLDDSRASERTLLRVLENQPALLPALRDLEGLHYREGDRQGLVRVYGAEVAAVEDEALRAAILRDLAHVQGVEADATSEVESVLERLVALRPHDREALETLASAARQRQDASRLLEIASTLASAEQDRSAAAAYRLTVAQLLEASASEKALEAYREALAIDPGSLVATRGLARMAMSRSDPDALRQAAEYEVSATRDDGLAVDLLMAASDIRRQQGDLEGAARDAQSALERAPDDPRAAAMLASVLEPRGERTRLADLLARAADRATRSERAAELYVQAATLRAPIDLSAAIATCERALDAESDHPEALGCLAGYLERAAEWSRAADTLARLAEVTRDASCRCDAHLALAEIAIERLNDPERAMPSLAKVVADRPDDRRALTLQGQLYARTGRMEEACDIAERLVEATREPEERASALVNAAKVMEQCGKREQAEQAVLEAVSLEGHDGGAARAYRARVADGRGGWAAYVEALERYLRAATENKQNAATTVRAIAEVQLREQEAHESALSTLKAGMEKWPDEPGLHVDHARVLQAMGQFGLALNAYRDQLDLYPESPALWRGLSAAHRAAGREDEALSAGVPLFLLDAAEGKEVIELQLRRPRPGAAEPGTLDDAMLRAIDHEGALLSPAMDLVRELTGTFGKLHPPDLASYGVTRRDRVDREVDPALWEAVERVANVLALTTDAFELYVHNQPDLHVSVALTEPPSLLVPRALTAQPPAALVFALAAPMFLLSLGLSPLAANEPGTLLLQLAGAVRRQREAFGSGQWEEEDLEDATRAVAKAIPWRSRKKVDEAIASAGELSPGDLQSWVEATQRTAARVSLLLSDDPVASLQTLAADAGREVLGDALSRELLSFWASETASRYRSQL